MTLASGTHLGPYEILAPLGAGGMGEVWKAKDTRLDRLVAIKVLPEHLAKHPDSLARFEREAKAVAALNHPNITGIHDFTTQGETTYVVMELLEGESLRDRLLQGPLAPRKAIELAVQMAHGLAAAHDKGIIHRDLKPDNLWITKDGRLKILDFGLAKQVVLSGHGSQSFLATQAVGPGQAMHTEEGMILGTMGYMSPEQVRGETVDARSDIFSFGAVLFEMLTGKKAFARDTAADTLAAILKEEPPDLEQTSRPIPSGLQRILHRCLEKHSSHRFHDAEDLAFALTNLDSGTGSSASFAAPFARPNLKTTRLWAAVVALALLASLGAGWWIRSPKPEPTFKQLTFRRGNILSARFTPDGQNAVYAAAWDGRPPELFLARLDGTSARPLGLAKASVQSINRQGEILVLLRGERWGERDLGVLAQIPMEGGVPREILERVMCADFGPDGKEMAVVYQPTLGGPQRLDFPLGKRILEMESPAIFNARVSPKGNLVAIAYYDDVTDTTVLAVVDRRGDRRILLKLSPFEFQTGPSWSPDGQALYFTANQTLQKVDLKGGMSSIRWDSSLSGVNDVSTQGRILMERYIVQRATAARRDGKEVDLSYSDKTEIRGLSADGGQAFINAFGGVGGSLGQVGIRRTDGSPPKLLGTGFGLDQSPDGKWVIIAPIGQTDYFNLAPTGAGVTRELRHPGWSLLDAFFTADGRHVLVQGRQSKAAMQQLLRFPVAGGPAEVLPGKAPFTSAFSSEDGRKLLTLDNQRRLVFRNLESGEATILAPTLAEGEWILGWDHKDQILVGQLNKPVSVSLDLVDLTTGQRKPWQVVGPDDASGVMGFTNLRASRDFKTLVYSYRRIITSDLFVVDGLR